MSANVGKSRENTSLDVRTLPGAFGDADYSSSRNIAQMISQRTGIKSPFATPLEEALLNPKYGADTASEQSLINSILDLTAGRSATRGLGAPTEGNMAAAIAPTLVDLRNKDIQNLTGAEQVSQQGSQADMQALLELLGYSMPQVVAGQKGQKKSYNYGVSGPAVSTPA